MKKVDLSKFTSSDVKKVNSIDLQKQWREYKDQVKDEESGITNFSQSLTYRTREELKDYEPALSGDGFNLQLLAKGLTGDYSDAALAGAFFDTANRPLYPEFIIRNLYESPIVAPRDAIDDDVLAARIMVNGSVAVRPKITDSGGPVLAVKESGAAMKKSKMTIDSDTTNVMCLACEFDVPDEVVRRWSINLLEVAIRRKGLQMKKDIVKEVVNKAYAAANTAGYVASGAALNYNNLVDFMEAMSAQGFDPNILLVTTTHLTTFLKMTEFKDSRLFDMAKTGNVPTIMGNQLKRIPTTTDLGSTMFMALDKSAAMAQSIEVGSEVAESDRFIRELVQAFTYSIDTTFWDFFVRAIRVFTVS